jgi:hypothetical protein
MRGLFLTSGRPQGQRDISWEPGPERKSQIEETLIGDRAKKVDLSLIGGSLIAACAPNCTEARNSTIVDGRVRGQRIEDRYGYRYSLVELRCGGAACTRALCICRISFGGSCAGTVVRTFRLLRETRSFCAGLIDPVATSIARSGIVLDDEP